MSHIEETSTRQVVTAIRATFPDTDQTIPYRLVGSYEYGKAMEAFTYLLNISKQGELAVYDDVLNNRPEFTYFNGANTAFAARPDLQRADAFQRKQFYDSFQKKGLAWMMALARVELGATMSMYGKSKAPFHTIATSDFDLPAYVQVLFDDVVAHMKSLAQEPGFNNVTKRGRPIDTWTLAYLRRLKLVRDMLRSLNAIGNPELKARLAPYDRELAKFEKRLMKEVYVQTKPQFDVDTMTDTKNSTAYGFQVSNEAIEDCQADINNRIPSIGTSKGASPRHTPIVRPRGNISTLQ